MHANGTEIPSVAPGGATILSGGTSRAAPQVVNHAAKLLALGPNLTIELRLAIISAADEKSPRASPAGC